MELTSRIEAVLFEGVDVNASEADDILRDVLIELPALQACKALFDRIDMRDLCPIASINGETWDWVHYCSETLHEHPTVPQFIGELKRRAAFDQKAGE